MSLLRQCSALLWLSWQAVANTPASIPLQEGSITLPARHKVVAKESPFAANDETLARVSPTLATCVADELPPQLPHALPARASRHRFELAGLIHTQGAYFAILRLPSNQLIWVRAGDDVQRGQAFVERVTARGAALLERAADGRCYRAWLSLSAQGENDAQ